MPARFSESAYVLPVAVDVARELQLPVGPMTLGSPSVLAPMAMPKTTVY